ncbi:MAG: peptidoglycan DD-metalloendopeptidase family protein [Deferribacterota bacterium]|nr:peptidoglycan DD-metalloendopeptidase family protein [Deferribacterota bacterium]
MISKNKKNKLKDVTLLVFDNYKYKEVKSLKINLKYLYICGFICLILFIMLFVSYIYLIEIYLQRDNLLAYKSENKELKSKIKEYDELVASLNKKFINVKIYENKLNSLLNEVKKQMGNIDLSIGGTEFEATNEEWELSAKIKEKEFFNQLDDYLKKLDENLTKKEKHIKSSLLELEKYTIKYQSLPNISPVDTGYISSIFGYRISPFSGRRVIHSGLDIATNYGTPIKAVANGIVIFAGYKALYGRMVMIDHGYGYITRYGHCSKLLVKEGDYVKRGQTIAKIGSTGRSTGPHVHYEVLYKGVPINPQEFINDDVFS